MNKTPPPRGETYRNGAYIRRIKSIIKKIADQYVNLKTEEKVALGVKQSIVEKLATLDTNQFHDLLRYTENTKKTLTLTTMDIGEQQRILDTQMEIEEEEKRKRKEEKEKKDEEKRQQQARDWQREMDRSWQAQEWGHDQTRRQDQAWDDAAGMFELDEDETEQYIV